MLTRSSPDRIAPGGIVIGALHSAGAVSAATSLLGRRTLQVAVAGDLIGSVEQDGARAILLELGHPGFSELVTRLSVVGTDLPIVVILPADRLPADDLYSLARIATFSVARDAAELPRVLRRLSTQRASSDVSQIAQALETRLAPTTAALVLGLYAVGTRTSSVAEAARRLGIGGGLRNQLRYRGLARASTILGWASALVVVWRTEREGESLAEAARAAGFDTTRQCSDRVLYHTGRTPTTLKERHGFDALVEEFMCVVGPHAHAVV